MNKSLILVILILVILLVLIIDYFLKKRKKFKEDKVEAVKREEDYQNRQPFLFSVRFTRTFYVVVTFFLFIFYIGCNTFIPAYYADKGKCKKADKYWMIFNDSEYPDCNRKRFRRSYR